MFWLIFLAAAGILIAAGWFGLGYLGFRTAILRGRELNIYDRASVRGTSWDKYYDEIMEGIQWIHAQEAEDIWLTSRDGLKLHGRLIKNPQAEGTVIMFHGYRTNGDVDFSAAAHVYHECGNHILLVDQRACGRSEGRYIGFGVLERYDAGSWARYVSRRFGPDRRIILSGLSMGASTVLMALSVDLPDNVVGLVADSAFSSPRDIIRNQIHQSYHISGRWITAAIDFWSRRRAGYALDEMSTLEAVRGSRRTILFAHGTADSRVPLEMTLKAAELSEGETLMVITEGAEHGTGYLADNARYRKALQKICTLPVPASEIRKTASGE
jgi:pimeloyl-ACP methyl ester carboxylesterase